MVSSYSGALLRCIMLVCCCKISVWCSECSIMGLMDSRCRTPSRKETFLIWDLSRAMPVKARHSPKRHILLWLLPNPLLHPHRGDKAFRKSLNPDNSEEDGDKLCVSQAWGDSCEVCYNCLNVIIPGTSSDTMRQSAVILAGQRHSRDFYRVNLHVSSLAHLTVPFGTWRPASPAVFLVPDYFQTPLVNCPLPSLYMAPGFFSSGLASNSFCLSELFFVQLMVTVTYNTSIAHVMGKTLFSVLYIYYLYGLTGPLGCRHTLQVMKLRNGEFNSSMITQLLSSRGGAWIQKWDFRVHGLVLLVVKISCFSLG